MNEPYTDRVVQSTFCQELSLSDEVLLLMSQYLLIRISDQFHLYFIAEHTLMKLIVCSYIFFCLYRYVYNSFCYT